MISISYEVESLENPRKGAKQVRRARKVDMNREIERLATLPWTVEMRRSHDGSIFARIVELPGCMTEGADRQKALRNLDEALRLWLAVELSEGLSFRSLLEPRLIRVSSWCGLPLSCTASPQRLLSITACH